MPPLREVRLSEDIDRVVNDIAAAHGTKRDLISAANLIVRSFSAGGQVAADAVANTVASVLNGGGTIADARTAVQTVLGFAQHRGPALAADAGRVADIIFSSHGTIGDFTRATDDIGRAFNVGGQNAADAVVRAAQAVAGAGGDREDIYDVISVVVDHTEEFALEPIPGHSAADYAASIANAAEQAAIGGGTPSDIISAAERVGSVSATAFPLAPSFEANPAVRESVPSADNLTSLGNVVTAPVIFEAPQTIHNPFPAPAENEAYNKLLADIGSGAGKDAIESDAAQLAVVAGEQGDARLASVAIHVGDTLNDGSYDAAASTKDLKNNPPSTPFGLTPNVPLWQDNSALAEAYHQLQQEVASGGQTLPTGNVMPDPQKIKSDADRLAGLAKDAGQPGLATAAANISTSISNGTYDQTASLTALMDNPIPQTLISRSPMPPPPGPPSVGRRRRHHHL
ncbi:hypothetical protein [Bradyrhizobium sp. STM 3557]|uniref:hypothetical protein n=1 Tax=Bradyrhizobium sp. STM 3557 TaxID=578920 RepID=UPI00388D935B